MQTRATGPTLAVDSTLRYLYIALRNSKASLIAIEFKHRGKTWRADTIEEAVELRKKLESEDRRSPNWDKAAQELIDREQSPWTPDTVMELVNGLGQLQRKFLAVVFEFSHVTSASVVSKLKLDSAVALAGVLSGLSKQLKKMGISPRKLYRVDIKWDGKTKERFFDLAPDFKMTAIEMGWPDEFPIKKTES
jgi:hypothetical protein